MNVTKWFVVGVRPVAPVYVYAGMHDTKKQAMVVIGGLKRDRYVCLPPEKIVREIKVK